MNLFKRKVDDSPLYPLCGNDNESIMHAIRDCLNVRKIWLMSGLFWDIRIWEVSEGWEWLSLVWDLKGATPELIVTIARLLWYARNTFIHDEGPWKVGGILDKAEAALAEFQAENSANLHSLATLVVHPVKWEVPPVFDAAWD